MPISRMRLCSVAGLVVVPPLRSTPWLSILFRMRALFVRIHTGTYDMRIGRLFLPASPGTAHAVGGSPSSEARRADNLLADKPSPLAPLWTAGLFVF
jgi:hypothetical protein